jgi:phosphocarrier protein
VLVAKDGQTVSGRSIMGVMTLAATQGSSIEVVTRGRQAAEALEAIRALVAAKFNEPN